MDAVRAKGSQLSAIAHCRPNLVDDLAHTRGAKQLITVESVGYSVTDATLEAWYRVGRCWVRHFGPWASRIGFSGFSNHHVEGDNTTPTGIYGVGGVLYGNAPNPGVHFVFHRIVCGDWWDEDPGSPSYNRFVHMPCGTAPPFGGASEPLWEEPRAYPIFAFIEYNASPVVPGRGSAIFLHADIGGPTSGCVTVHLPELDALMRWLEPFDHPMIVMGPRSEIEHF